MPPTHQAGKLIPHFDGWFPLDWKGDKILSGDRLVEFGSNPGSTKREWIFTANRLTPAEVYGVSILDKYLIYRKINNHALNYAWILMPDNEIIRDGDFLGADGLDPNQMPEVNENGYAKSGVIAREHGYASEGRTAGYYSKNQGYKINCWRLGQSNGVRRRRLPPNQNFIQPLPLP